MLLITDIDYNKKCRNCFLVSAFLLLTVFNDF